MMRNSKRSRILFTRTLGYIKTFRNCECLVYSEALGAKNYCFSNVNCLMIAFVLFSALQVVYISHNSLRAGLHKLWYPGIRDTSTWSKLGAHGEHGDVFLFSNLGAL